MHYIFITSFYVVGTSAITPKGSALLVVFNIIFLDPFIKYTVYISLSSLFQIYLYNANLKAIGKRGGKIWVCY